VSCDESYVEINIESNDAGDYVFAFVNTLAENIRTDIVRNTSCTASIGIGPNKFLAKLAADRVKPNACCVVRDWKKFLDNVSLRDIPGIGRKLETKLQPYGLCTVNDIWELNQDAVSIVGEIIGAGNATKIVQFCHGKDDRIVSPAIRKSIGAECNYGVRFDGPYGIDYMMNGLAKEVHSRMAKSAVRGTKLVLKLMKSKDTSKLPGKFLGHGSCDSLSRSIDISLTREQDVIFSAAMKLYEKIGVDESSIRGVGIVINSLISDDEASTSSPSKLFDWLQKDNSVENIPDETSYYCETMPSFSQLDQDVLSNLPEDVLAEVRSTYGKNRINNNSSLPALSKSRSPQKDKPIPIVGQPSVRRMLKLACIKSGEEELDNNDFTLSQLDSLPMERQLQLANGDAIEIVKGSKYRTNKIAITDHIDASDDEKFPFRDERDSDSPKDMPIINFHHANIKPLQEFILANPTPDSEVVDTVQDFFSVCIHERRIDDVVILLRSIKNMNDGWNRNIYSRLRDSILDLITFTTGDELDVQWLGI
jgi:DNA repair protein REV1